MNNDFNKIQDIILSIDNLSQVEVCEKLIKNFRETHEEGINFAFTLLGMLTATTILKFQS